MTESQNSQKPGISPIASETRGVSAETGFLNSFIRTLVMFCIYGYELTLSVPESMMADTSGGNC
jgi:hypothetical protein